MSLGDLVANLPTVYWIGVLGSITIECGVALKETTDRHGSLPPRYLKLPFISIRILFAFLAGSIPVMLEAASHLSAFYLGASAPLFLDKLQRGVDPTLPPPENGN